MFFFCFLNADNFFISHHTRRQNFKCRIVHLVEGTVRTRYNPQSPLLVVLFIDMHGNKGRGYSFGQRRIAMIKTLLHVDDIAFISNAEVEVSNDTLTWIRSLTQIKFIDETRFRIGDVDEQFPKLTWDVKTIQSIAEEEPVDEIGKILFISIFLKFCK